MKEPSVVIEKFNVPEEVSRVTQALKEAGFEAYLVGGCVRDLFMGKEPKDWDVTTNATPEQIIPLFPKTFYENAFGTVSVVNEDSHETLKVIEVTPYRLESPYSDHRRPDQVQFSQSIEDDLQRRDFSINSIAYDSETAEVIDPYGGIADLARHLIKTVGNPKDRFFEDGLRILRAVRFHVELGFLIDPETEKAMLDNKEIISKVSRERIRDEILKIVISPNPMAGFLMLRKLGLLHFIIPELESTFDVEQGGAHSYDVWTHLLKSLQHAADKGYPLHVRLAALFHDISKPETRRKGSHKEWTFYGHEVVGSRVTSKILTNLKVPRETSEKVVKLVRWHMFFSDTETITPSAVRRLIAQVGKDLIWDLINLRICDRIGTGRPKEDPYRLRKYQAMIEEVMRDPISVAMLKINGAQIMKVGNIAPGPKVGAILEILLEDVLEDPSLNTEEYLNQKTKELVIKDEKELKDIAQKSKQIKEQFESEELGEIRKRHRVQ